METKDEQQIITLIELYRSEFGVDLTIASAIEELAKLRQLYRLVYLSPLTPNDRIAMAAFFEARKT